MVISEKTGLPISISGPFSGPTADIQIFHYKAKHMMVDHEFVGLADGTYQGEDNILIIPPCPYASLGVLEKEIHCAIVRRRVLIENLYSQLKVFACLHSCWRHHMSLHFLAFYVILCCVSIDLLYSPLRK